jgi:hypothetical protein
MSADAAGTSARATSYLKLRNFLDHRNESQVREAVFSKHHYKETNL